MFKKKRLEQDRERYREQERWETKRRAYQMANENEQGICDLFDGAKVEVGNKTASLECEFRSNGLVIICRAPNSDFKLFESTSSFEDRVKSMIRERIMDYGYYIYPPVYFRYL